VAVVSDLALFILFGIAALSRASRPTTPRDPHPMVGRMLGLELPDGAHPAEARGILDVLAHRVRVYGASVEDVLLSRARGPEWGSGCGDGVCDYNTIITNPARPSHPAYLSALAMAPVAAGALAFLHPLHPAFASPGPGRIPARVAGRTVYLPRWAVARGEGGAASRVTDVGRTPTRFAWT
jgi:hypothetical protein